MSATNLSAAASAIGTVYAKLALRDVMEDAFWSQFAGLPGSGMPIIKRTEILDGPGSSITVPVTSKLTGAGRTEEQTLSGQEEALTVSNVVLTPQFKRHGVLNERLAQMRSSISLHEEARMRLAEWGRETVDADRFTAFSVATGTPNTYFGEGAAIGSITAAGGKLTVAHIRGIKKALITNGAVPMQTRNGAKLYGMVVTPSMEFDVKSDSAWNTAVVQAGERGLDNPWLSGALGVIDGVAIFVDRGVVTATDGAASAKVARGLAFGAEAFVEGWQEQAFWADDKFDYEGQHGFSFGYSFQAVRSPVKKNVVLGYFASA